MIEKISSDTKNMDTSDRIFTIHFNADVSDSLPWKFQPSQDELKVKASETTLAFYKVYNPTDEAIVGISTYNVTPQKAGIYFNKIQCFCFEEQRLKAKESIEMPIFFFLDPDILEDSRMDEVTVITLSYTFFPVTQN